MISIPEETIGLGFRIILASILGGLIGLERDMHGRSAGLRTHLLVSLGASVFMILSRLIAESPLGVAALADPGRIAAQIIVGIGFIGAGVIIKEGVNIRGLTTAACLWTAAAIGMATGGGYYPIALFTTGIALASLILLKYLERIYPKHSYRILSITIPSDSETSHIIDLVKRKGVNILNLDIKKNYNTNITEMKLYIRLFYKGLTNKLEYHILNTLEKSKIAMMEVKWESG
ncbi:MgtC/SapB family protein [bacterium]|nr:MgtC/SapB family protein [bacterium]